MAGKAGYIMKKAITIAIASVLIILTAVFAFFSYKHNKITYNNDNAVGNTAGNLNNGGLFCEYNDKIYFANPYDDNKLYVMNSDCTDARKLNDDSVASVNVCGNYIYYVKNNFKQSTIGTIFRGQLFGVYRCDLNGESQKVLYNKISGIIALAGNSLYYQHYSDTVPLAFHKIDIAGKKDEKISDTPYSPACVQNGTIYFSDPDGKHNILSYDTKSGNTSVYYNCNSYLADVENGYAYYIDLSKNYSLVRYNPSNKTLELLYSKDGAKVINYNVYGNKIFFQLEGDASVTGLYRMNIDGTQIEPIAIGNITNIHCTSKYTFFQYFENQGVLYRVNTSAPDTSVEQITVK